MTDGFHHLYLVRCNFNGGSDAEQAWNDWYSGPKMDDMLRMPMFLHGQRFRSIGMDQDVRYLTIWTLASPAAFDTPRYLIRWGFAEWADQVADWSRDLFRPISPVGRVDVPAAATMVVTAFADAVVDQAILPNALWCESEGLDQTWPWVAIEVSADPAAITTPDPAWQIAWRTRYAPLDAGRSTPHWQPARHEGELR